MAKKLVRQLLLLSAAAFVLAPTAVQFAYAGSPSKAAIETLNRLGATKGGEWGVEWTPSGGAVVQLHGGPVLAAPDISASARDFLSRGKSVFGLDGYSVVLASERHSNGDIHLSFQKVYAGKRVFNVYIDLHVTAGGKLYLLNSNSIAGDAGSARAAGAPMSSAQAFDLAKGEMARTVLHDKSGAPVTPVLPANGERELGYFETDNGDVLAWRISMGSVEYILDAVTGAVLDTRILKLSVNGTGTVFDPNPVYTLNKGTLRDQANANYAALSSAYRTKTLYGIQKSGTGTGLRYKLIGPYARAMDIGVASLPGTCIAQETEVRLAPPSQKTSQFKFNRSQSGFEHTMAYYTLDRNQRYIQSLGFGALWNASIRVDAHAMKADNSFYCASPHGAGYLAFGDGGVDDAEDADVILHEYGHALQDASSGGRYLSGGQAGAMGEGFGDYWAYSTYHSGTWGNCFADWDSQGTCLRRLDKNKKYPRDYVGQVHKDGEIWSRGLRDLYLKIGKEKADKIILKSHFLIATSPNFTKGVAALLDADTALFSGAYKNDICAVFIDRGISTRDCGYWFRLTWNKVGADVDLHLRPPSGSSNLSWNYASDVAYYNRNPNWNDPAETEDDPLLYQDCISTCAMEKITVSDLTTVGTYKVLAHYYSPHGYGATTATMDYFKNGKLIGTKSATLTNTAGVPSDGDVWFPFSIKITASKAPEVIVENRMMPLASMTSGGPEK
ncbi:M36 family metallopeptidase [Oryzibacter oryziterrae]|uniref:M36 family metallopeptidase n=1 Tax=Oryzibacter oryziterrae TaxID=2766474 RepID=UPI001F031EAC|nr:M36 family metallopeptidase [Oryzibacter oryziterrae]